jgi:hypothetical protein
MDFTTPKIKNAFILTKLIVDLPLDSKDTPLSENFPVEHLFFISSNDPWYGDILVYLCTQKFCPHLSQ